MQLWNLKWALIVFYESFLSLFEVASIRASTSAHKYVDLDNITKRVLPRCKSIYESNPSDVTLCLVVLSCLEKILDKLERTTVIDEVLPILYDVRLQDAEVTVKVVSKFAQKSKWRLCVEV